MNPCRLTWDDIGFDNQFIAKELKEFLPNYLSHTRDVNLSSKVSSDFYTDIYQPIEYEIYKHESYVEHFKRQSILVAIAVGFVLMELNTMLFVQLPMWMMRILGLVALILLIACLILLGVEMKTQISYYNRIKEKLIKKEKTITICLSSVKSQRILSKVIASLLSIIITVGLIFPVWAVLSIEIGILPMVPVFWKNLWCMGLTVSS